MMRKLKRNLAALAILCALAAAVFGLPNGAEATQPPGSDPSAAPAPDPFIMDTSAVEPRFRQISASIPRALGITSPSADSATSRKTSWI
jgi:hypothetical protein